MTSLRSILALLFVACAILTAGCMSDNPLFNKTAPSNTTPTTIPVQPVLVTPTTPALSSDEYWIEIDPIETAYKDYLTVSGTTNLPEDEMLDINVGTNVVYSKPPGYDYSHEVTGARTSVIWINTTTRGFIETIDVSDLRPGSYGTRVMSIANRGIYCNGPDFDLLPSQSQAEISHANYIYSKCPGLPLLHVNGSIEPVFITDNVALVPKESRTRSYQIPYGAIMLFSEEGIVRVFNKDGTQIDAIYDSNELRLWQIPGGTRVMEENNVTFIYLDEEKILTKVYESKPCG